MKMILGACLAAAALTGCTKAQYYLMGTEAKAIEICQNNGGVDYITTHATSIDGLQHDKISLRLTVVCKKDNIKSTIWLEGSTDGQAVTAQY